MSGHAQRQRDYRQRQKAGVSVFIVECSEADLAQALVNAGILNPFQADQRQAINAALNELIRLFVLENSR